MSELLWTAVNGVESLNALAKASGVPKSCLVRFRSGERGLNLETADRLARYFNIRCEHGKPRE